LNNAVVQVLKHHDIDKTWIASLSLDDILQLETEFIKGSYLTIGSRLEFKLKTKVRHFGPRE
jgi:hypothetical protein